MPKGHQSATSAPEFLSLFFKNQAVGRSEKCSPGQTQALYRAEKQSQPVGIFLAHSSKKIALIPHHQQLINLHSPSEKQIGSNAILIHNMCENHQFQLVFDHTKVPQRRKFQPHSAYSPSNTACLSTSKRKLPCCFSFSFFYSFICVETFKNIYNKTVK